MDPSRNEVMSYYIQQQFELVCGGLEHPKKSYHLIDHNDQSIPGFHSYEVNTVQFRIISTYVRLQ